MHSKEGVNNTFLVVGTFASSELRITNDEVTADLYDPLKKVRPTNTMSNAKESFFTSVAYLKRSKV